MKHNETLIFAMKHFVFIFFLYLCRSFMVLDV